MLTNGTTHLTTNEFADAVATASPGDRIIYAFGDVGCSASAPDAGELKELRRIAYGHYLDGRGHLTQWRCSDVKFRGHASFEYIFTVASPRLASRLAPEKPVRRRELVFA